MTRVWFMSYGWQCLFCKRMNGPKGTVCYNCGRDYSEECLRVATYAPMDLLPFRRLLPTLPCRLTHIHHVSVQAPPAGRFHGYPL